MCNIFRFTDNIYIQTAMGTKMAPSYADLFIQKRFPPETSQSYGKDTWMISFLVRQWCHSREHVEPPIFRCVTDMKNNILSLNALRKANVHQDKSPNSVISHVLQTLVGSICETSTEEKDTH